MTSNSLYSLVIETATQDSNAVLFLSENGQYFFREFPYMQSAKTYIFQLLNSIETEPDR